MHAMLNYILLNIMQPSAISDTTIGLNLLKLRSFPTNDYWYWIGIAVLIGYAILFNNVVTLALAYLNRESLYC